MSDRDTNSWGEYMRLVLAELKRLDENQDEELKRTEIIPALKDRLQGLEVWKSEVAEKEFQRFRDFRTQMITIGIIAQVLLGAIVGLIAYFK